MAKAKKTKIETIEEKLQSKYVEGEPRYSEDQSADRLEFARDQCINFIVLKAEELGKDNKGILIGQEMLSRTLANLTMLRRKGVKDGFASGMKIQISFEDDEEVIHNAKNHVKEAIVEGKKEHKKKK